MDWERRALSLMDWERRALSLCFTALWVVSQVSAEDDSQCLKDFKASVHDPHNRLSSWNFGNSSQGSVCSFTGVSCWNPQENKIMSLKLQNYGLSGTFPSGLVRCAALQNLDLSGNAFSGSIPSDICKQVPYLQSLDLSQNSFSGNIPFALQDCQYLQSLNLQNNRLSGEIPGGIGNLPKLTILDVSSNSLSGQIPSTFVNRPSNLGNGSPFPASAFIGNPDLCGPPLSDSCSSKSNTGMIIGIIVAVAAVLAVIGAGFMWFLLIRPRKENTTLFKDEQQWARSIRAPKSIIVSLFEQPLKKLKLSDLMAATNGFSKANIIGEGSTGTMYKAVLPDGSMLAVKLLSRSNRDFQAEIETLGKLRHRNLVPLLGYCSVASKKLLIYKHMVSGSLRECLHGGHDDIKLDWVARLKIAIGASRGLAWLHHTCNPRIIHRNINSNTILLDEEYEPRITDFGLARLINPVDTHISTVVSGDFGDLGYVPPEYSRTLTATVKGDVYSFGVVLLELATGQKANDVSTDDPFKGNLSEWITFLRSHGRAEEALDSSLKGQGFDNELKQFLRVGCACVVGNPKERPTMYEVYQLLVAIGEKFNISDDEGAAYMDFTIPSETDELISRNCY